MNHRRRGGDVVAGGGHEIVPLPQGEDFLDFPIAFHDCGRRGRGASKKSAVAALFQRGSFPEKKSHGERTTAVLAKYWARKALELGLFFTRSKGPQPTFSLLPLSHMGVATWSTARSHLGSDLQRRAHLRLLLGAKRT